MPNENAAGLTSFAFRNSAIRGGLINGEPHFVAEDICAALGIKYHRDAVARVPDWAKGAPLSLDGLDEFTGVRLDGSEGKTSVQGGRGYLATVKEPGVYYLALRSDKPEAEAFQKWVCTEVLPTLRKTGAYAAPVADGYVITGSGAERIERLRALLGCERSLVRYESRRAAILRGEPGTGGPATVVIEGAVPIQPHLVALLPHLATPRIRALVQLVVGRCGRAGLPVGRERTTSANGGQTNWQRTARPADILAVLPPADLAAGQKGGA